MREIRSTIENAVADLKKTGGHRYGGRICLVLALVALTCWLARYDRSLFADNDAFDYAQMGREIYLGHGASTLQIMPRQIPLLEEWGYLHAEHWPNLHRYPLPTFFIAGAMDSNRRAGRRVIFANASMSVSFRRSLT